MSYDPQIVARIKPVTFRIDEDLLDAMEQVREQHGTPYSEQIRRALRAWLEKAGTLATRKPERSRAATRKRS